MDTGVDWFKAQTRHRLLTADEERDLAQKIQAGDEQARETLILHNVRLVTQIALKMHGATTPGFDFDDLIQEGLIGLMRAAEKFDPNKGRFSTIAVWWIKQAMSRAIDERARSIRLPSHVHEDLSKIRRAEAAGQDLSTTGLKLSRIAACQAYIVTGHPTSLDRPLPANRVGTDDRSLTNLIADPNATDAADYAIECETRRRVRSALQCLPARLRAIMALRHGLDNQPAMTLDEIGRAFGLTRERVRQLEKDATNQLRALLAEPADYDIAA